MPYRNLDITFALSEATKSEFENALAELKKSKEEKHGTIKNITISFDRSDNPLGVIKVRERL